MKLIFLDIDGVLNNTQCAVVGLNEYNTDDLHLPSIKLLRLLMKITGAKLVISSSWKIYGNVDWWNGFLSAYDIPYKSVVGITDDYPDNFRGSEVKAFIDQFRTINNLESYVCLDDNDDFFKDQNLIQVDPIIGLSLYNIIEAVDVLGALPEAVDEYAEIKRIMK